MTDLLWEQRKPTPMTSPHVLVMSDGPASARAMSGLLTDSACHAEIVNNEAEALHRLRHKVAPDLVLLALNGARYSLLTLEHLLQFSPEIKVVVVSEHNQTRQIVEAIRLGARDFLTIPVGRRELEQVIGRHTEHGSSQHASLLSGSSRTLAVVRESVEDLGEGEYLIAASAAMQKIRVQAERLANIDAPVLILGENWTGKEAVARLIHKLSSRSRERFLEVNCAALPGEMLERELFGWQPDTTHGAHSAKPGKIELCHRGTILLKAVSEMPARMQAKLLHVLQDRECFRLGGEVPFEADVRILAATNTPMDAGVSERKLSEDLYYRLSAFVIQLPPLRDRREDTPALLQNFMARLAAQYSRPPVAFSRAAMDACLHYSWPGNLRELENFVKRYLVMGEEAIAHGELGPEAGPRNGQVNSWALQKKAPRSVPSTALVEEPTCHLKSMVRDVKDEAEIRAIRQALHDTGWNRKRAARLLDISYRGLLYKIRQHSLTQESEWVSTRVRDGQSAGNKEKNITYDFPEER